MVELLYKYKYLIVVIVGVALAFVAYQLWFVGNNEDLLKSQTQLSPAYVASERIIALLNDLRTLDLGDELFRDPVFQSLDNFEKELVPETVGRDNPFAPSSGVL